MLHTHVETSVAVREARIYHRYYPKMSQDDIRRYDDVRLYRYSNNPLKYQNRLFLVNLPKVRMT